MKTDGVESAGDSSQSTACAGDAGRRAQEACSKRIGSRRNSGVFFGVPGRFVESTERASSVKLLKRNARFIPRSLASYSRQFLFAPPGSALQWEISRLFNLRLRIAFRRGLAT